ncbi:MAG: sulfate reduction electron transfer complex DsrMKJOP subunit DsrJ [Deltaproteobacteria bacterium]|nr:sulfate reduction electron transfer complex DsrMKJOP subunit DsrJ [Deltaproteobacteria bacterium]
MSDSGKIITGIVIFVAAITFPFWFNMGKAAPAPELELPKDKTACVEATDYMRAQHQVLLHDWRESVVRKGDRIYFNGKGEGFEMSLQNTCIECHATKVNFCDRCHDYAGVTPFCWECHLEPEEKG